MVADLAALADLPKIHLDALAWFHERAGAQIAWPKPLEGLFLLNKAKGIHKPAGWQHVLSIRQSLNGPYADKEVVELPDGDWEYEYYQEGTDPAFRDADFTNRALLRNLDDGVPVAVVRQVSFKPAARYRVLGLASVVGWKDGYFQLRRYNAAASEGNAPPVSLADSRKRIDRAIVARQGSGAFRAVALAAFNGRCAISGYDVEEGLEAAHIVPYLGGHTNVRANALLLRADLHTLFDRGLIEIDPQSFRVTIARPLRKSCLAELHGTLVRFPDDGQGWRESLTLRHQLLAKPGRDCGTY